MSASRGITTRLRHRAVSMLLMMLGLCGAAFAGDDVSMRLEAFGGIGAFRPGDMVGVRVAIRSDLADPMECLLQWDLPNADGDMVAHTRPVTLTPAQSTQRWLYARLAPSVAARVANEVFTLRLFEMRDGQRVREMTSLRFKPAEAAQPPMPVEMTEGLIAVVGDGRMGLETMEATMTGNDVPAMQELTRLARGVKPASLPDRWEGLSSCEAIIWCGAAGPQALGNDRALALLDWIERGGHLVIVLPEIGDPWSVLGGPAHLLSQLLPRGGVVRCDALEVATLMPLLAKSPSLRRDGASMPLAAFDPATLDRGWQPLIPLPVTNAKDKQGKPLQGCALVAQRLWGHGRVTLVGLDLDTLHRQSLNAEGLPQTDAFWNRVLGRRADAPTETNYRDWAEQDKPTLASTAGNVRYDAGTGALVSGQIGLQGRAAAGVLSVIGFFLAYWALAIPVCWLVLRRIKRVQWAWPVFALLAAGAALPAWMLGLLFGGASSEVRHLSVIDYVLPRDREVEGDRPRLLRGEAWMSAALGGFGTASMRLQDETNQRNLLIDWSPPPNGNAQRFPDTARTEREIDDASQLRLPSRSTTVDVQALWLGAPPRDWGRVVWEDPEHTIRANTTGGASPAVSLAGSLWHGLPGPLHDVTLIHVGPWLYQSRKWTGSKDQRIEPSDFPPRPARMVRLTGDWEPGPLDVGRALYPQGGLNPAVVGDGSFVREIKNLYADPLRARGNFASLSARVGDTFEPDSWRKQLSMLGLYQMLKPPDYRMNPPAPTDSVVIRVTRQLGRDLDLSPWFTRPCLIVTGFLDDTACPVPLQIDGRTPTSRGNVMVRFILPLPCETAGSVIPFETVP